MLFSNTIVDTKNVEFLENGFPLKVVSVVAQPSFDIANENSCDDIKKKIIIKRDILESDFLYLSS